MEPETKEKIEETVLAILKDADMDNMTEFKVRTAAAEQLGLDLSGADRKRLVRSIVESFLLSKQAETESGVVAGSVEEAGGEGEPDEEEEPVICRLSNNRRVTIQEFRGVPLVSIREYYERDGEQLPSRKGISLTAEQWAAFSKAVPAIEDAIKKLEGR